MIQRRIQVFFWGGGGVTDGGVWLGGDVVSYPDPTDVSIIA